MSGGEIKACLNNQEFAYMSRKTDGYNVDDFNSISINISGDDRTLWYPKNQWGYWYIANNNVNTAFGFSSAVYPQDVACIVTVSGDKVHFVKSNSTPVSVSNGTYLVYLTNGTFTVDSVSFRKILYMKKMMDF